jgi:hypothetical protein
MQMCSQNACFSVPFLAFGIGVVLGGSRDFSGSPGGLAPPFANRDITVPTLSIT